MEILIFHNQISKVTSDHLCLIRLLEASHKALPTLMGRGLQKVWIPGGGDHWGHLGVCLVIFPFLVYGSTTSSVVQAPSGGVLLDSSLSVILSIRHSNLPPDDLSDLTSFLCRVLAFLLFWEAQSHLRAFAPAVPSAWNSLPSDMCMVSPSASLTSLLSRYDLGLQSHLKPGLGKDPLSSSLSFNMNSLNMHS